jgi:hypothetical protein
MPQPLCSAIVRCDHRKTGTSIVIPLKTDACCTAARSEALLQAKLTFPSRKPRRAPVRGDAVMPPGSLCCPPFATVSPPCRGRDNGSHCPEHDSRRDLRAGRPQSAYLSKPSRLGMTCRRLISVLAGKGADRNLQQARTALN